MKTATKRRKAKKRRHLRKEPILIEVDYEAIGMDLAKLQATFNDRKLSGDIEYPITFIDEAASIPSVVWERIKTRTLSSPGPNIQNIRKGEENEKKFIVPLRDYILVESDYCSECGDTRTVRNEVFGVGSEGLLGKK